MFENSNILGFPYVAFIYFKGGIMFNDKKEEQAKKIIEKEQKQRDVVNCF